MSVNFTATCTPEKKQLPMKKLNVNQAIAEALHEEMQRDEHVMLMGEGVATKHHELAQMFGTDRVRNTPLAEAIIAGTAVGAAASGLRPVVDLLFAPFLAYAMDAIVNSAGKLRFLSGGQFEFPVVFMAMTGAGWGIGAQHNHNLEAWFTHAPGLKVVMPSTPADFKGLLKAAIRDDNPVLFFSDIALGALEAEVEAGTNVVVPLGRAAVRRCGLDVTLVAYGKAVGACLQAAEQLDELGLSCEVIDLRTLKPWDREAVLRSVRKTGRLVTVHEANVCGGLGGEIAAVVAQEAFDALCAPIVRLGGLDAPAAASWVLEQAGIPQVDSIVHAVRDMVQRVAPAAQRIQQAELVADEQAR
jgi:acetoin:2,6-dichlorophenolindophenol oxidoreductase subunit beta